MMAAVKNMRASPVSSPRRSVRFPANLFFHAVEDVITMKQNEDASRKKGRKELSLAEQVLIVLLVVATLMLLVLFVDIFLDDVGKDWSQSTLVKMIIERRGGAIPLFE
jgi:hypothetical protein